MLGSNASRRFLDHERVSPIAAQRASGPGERSRLQRQITATSFSNVIKCAKDVGHYGE
jgi:hypothetical protein